MSYEVPKTYLFLDIETTGLQPDAQLLEIACILVRAKDFVKINDFQVLVKPIATISDDKVWDPVAAEFHCKNMLLADIVGKQSCWPRDALEKFYQYLEKCGLPAKSCVIAGSSVHTDVAFLKKQLATYFNHHPVFEGFSHRLLDLSTLRTIDKMCGSKLFDDKTDDSHRAMGDCLHDLNQLTTCVARLRTLYADAAMLPILEEGRG